MKRWVYVLVMGSLLIAAYFFILFLSARYEAFATVSEAESQANLASTTVWTAEKLRGTAEFQLQAANSTTTAEITQLQVTIEAQFALVQATAEANLQTELAANTAELKKDAIAAQLVQESNLLLNQQPNLTERSVLLAIESVQRAPSPGGTQTLQQSLALLPQKVIQLKLGEGSILDIEFSENNRYIAADCDQNNLAHVWDLNTGEEIAHFEHEHCNTVVFSPDEKYLVTGGHDDFVRVWEIETGQQVTEMMVEGGLWWQALAFSVDGAYLVAAMEKGPAKIWDTHHWQEVAQVAHDPGFTGNSLAFSLDGYYLVTINGYKTATIWEASTGLEVASFVEEGTIESIALSPDGKYLATAGFYFTSLWEVESGNKLELPTLAGLADKLTFSEDGRYLAALRHEGYTRGIASGDNSAQVWHIPNGQQVRLLEKYARVMTAHSNKIYLVSGGGPSAIRIWELISGEEIVRLPTGKWSDSLSPDGQYLAIYGNGAINIWNMRPFQTDATLSHEEDIFDVTFSPDGQYMSAASQDGSALIWDATSKQEILQVVHDDTPIKKVAFSPGGRYLITSGGNISGYGHYRESTTRIWDIVTGVEIAHLPDEAPVWSFDVSPNGRYIATSNITGTVRVWDWENTNAQELDHSPPLYPEPEDIIFSPDGQYLVAENNESILVWKTDTWELMHTFPYDILRGIAFSSDSHYLIGDSLDNTIRIWELTTGNEIANFPHEESVQTFALSPDGYFLAIGTGSGIIHIWTVTPPEEIVAITYDRDINDVAFSENGEYLAATSWWDSTLRIWEVANGKEVMRMGLIGHPDRIIFQPDGKNIAIEFSLLRHIWLGLWNPEDLVTEACQRLTRNLTMAEWQIYFGDEPYRATCPDLPLP